MLNCWTILESLNDIFFIKAIVLVIANSKIIFSLKNKFADEMLNNKTLIKTLSRDW
jgi:hypothetical protein